MVNYIYHRIIKLIIIQFFILNIVYVSGTLAQEKRFELYGYSQVDFSVSNSSGSFSGFNQRRLNLIGEFFLDHKIRVLSDVEFEGGTDITPNDPNSVGTVKISRAWMEYSFSSELKIRGGKMITPFGIYNLIHDASASYFAVDPPLMYSDLRLFKSLQPNKLFSKYYTGIEVLGTFDLDRDGSQLEYSVGIGNGRGLNSAGEDLNNNRSISARIMYRPSLLRGFQIGSSFYMDRNYMGLGGVKNDFEYAYGFDMQYEDSELQIQVEGLASSYKLLNKGRITTGISYIQIAYTFFDILTPFANYSIALIDLSNKESGFHRFNFGVNYAISPYLFLKTEIQFHQTEEEFSENSFNVFKISAAIAF